MISGRVWPKLAGATLITDISYVSLLLIFPSDHIHISRGEIN